MQMHKKSAQFDPSQPISTKHYKYQKDGAQKEILYREIQNLANSLVIQIDLMGSP